MDGRSMGYLMVKVAEVLEVRQGATRKVHVDPDILRTFAP
jgi:hypothetical protein